MTGGEKILLAGAVGLGVVALIKARSASSPSATGNYPPKGSTVNSDISANDYIGAIPVVGQAYRVLKPVAPVVQSAVRRVNSAVGGVDPFAGLTANGDGTYTDGSGCKLTPQPDGTVTRDCGSWDKNIKNPSKTTVIATGGIVYLAKWAGL